MEIPEGKFFEVTINSNKLLSYMNQLTQQIKEQQAKMEQFKAFTNNFEDQMFVKINKKFNDHSIEWQRRHKTNCENISQLKLYLKDHDKKTDQKFSEIEDVISKINSRITRVKDSIEEDTCIKLSYFQKKMENNVTSQELEKILEEEFGRVNSELKRIAQNEEEKGNKVDQEMKKFEQLKNILSARTHERSPFSKTLCDFDEAQKPKQARRKRARTQRQGGIIQQPAQIQLFVRKIQELEAKITKKAQRQNQISQEARGKELSKLILDKLEIISTQYTQKVIYLQEKVHRLCNRYDILNEQVSILSRKIDKYKGKQLQSTDLLKHLEERKMDEKELQQIKNNIKIIAKQLEDSINKKLSIDLYEKQYAKIKQKLALIFEISGDKCQKSEVKRIFTFLESKIKQIIIIMAEEKNFIKDGACKKIPVKCLSCDKDLDPLQVIQSSPPSYFGHRSIRSSLGSGRPSFNNLRKRGKFNNSASNDD